MTDDDLLREASDPTTLSERLRELSRGVPLGHEFPDALARNPSLPLDLLRRELLDGWTGAAWYNPATPLLLQAEPLPAYERAAWQSLCQLADTESDDGPRGVSTLAEAVALCARRRHHRPRWSGTERFARHLASLFGLPWPEP